MSEPDNLPAADSVVCPNCGRAEADSAVRFCPNCGAVLPVFASRRTTQTGFAALAQQIPPPEQTAGNTPPAPPVKVETPATRQPWAITPDGVAAGFTPLEDDESGPFLSRNLWGDRALGFIGEVGAVTLGVGILIATGEAANGNTLPIWAAPVIFVAGGALLALCLWQAKRLRETYPQLARGWYAGRSIWENTILPILIGIVVVGLMLLLLGPLGLLAVCLGGVAIAALGPFGWLLLAVFIFVVGRVILFLIRRNRKR